MSAGRTLARITVAPALLVVAWLAVSLPLLLAGRFGPGTAIALFVPAAAVTLVLGLRGSTRPNALALSADQKVSWWVVVGVVAVAVAFLVLQLAMCSEQIIVRRDPASYVQFATWLTGHGSLPIPDMRWAFGGGDPALAYESPAFYQRGDGLVPQFMAGLPMILALGGWIGGTPMMLAMGPVLGACAVLSFGGLTARLVGPRWAPAGALALALTLPMMYVSRGTYSEAAALVLLLGGLALLHDVRDLRPSPDAMPPWKQPVRIRAFLAGSALGMVVLVRIDGLRDILPVIVFAGLLMARRRRTAGPLFLGLALGACGGLVEGYTLSRPYLSYLRDSLNPLLALTGVLIVGTAAMVVLARVGRTGRRLRRIGLWIASGRLPDLAAVTTILVMIAFAIRPYVQTVIRVPRSEDDKLNASFISYAQQANGLAEEFGRQYTELSFSWLVWYVGIPAVLLGAFGAALLARRMLRRQSPEWVLPFMVIAWTTVTTLWRPGITPDHPWASRRLITVVIPGMLLLAFWGLAAIVRHVRRHHPERRPAERTDKGTAGGSGPVRRSPRYQAVTLAALGTLTVLGPITVSSAALTFTRVEQGEVGAVRRMCGQLGPGRSVVIVDRLTADRFSQVIRGMCGVPTARAAATLKSRVPDQADMRRVIEKIQQAGRRPVIMASTASAVAPYGTPKRVVHISTRQEEHSLVSPPDGTWRLTITVWTAELSAPY